MASGDADSDIKALQAGLYFTLKALHEYRMVDPERIDRVIQSNEALLPKSERPTPEPFWHWAAHAGRFRHAFVSPHDAVAVCKRRIAMPRTTIGYQPLCGDCLKRGAR